MPTGVRSFRGEGYRLVPMSDEHLHPRPEQAEEPEDDVGASNVDLDEARHGAAHVSPAAPEPAHDPDADHHDEHGAHDDHPVDDPKWVIAPLVLGAVIGIVLIVVLGFQSGASPFHQL